MFQAHFQIHIKQILPGFVWNLITICLDFHNLSGYFPARKWAGYQKNRKRGKLLETLYAIALGIIQGLTEFLPVSSSGHLVLLQNVFGMTEPELLLDIWLHVGTLTAVVVVFFKEIVSILNMLINFPRLYRKHKGLAAMFKENQDVRLAGLIIFGSIPTGILGLVFHEMAEQIFSSVQIVGIMLLITGTFLWLTRWASTHGRTLNRMKISDSLFVGLAQGLAILPGISRSGATISAALFLGIDRELAGRFSFLLCIPAIAGAMILSLNSPVANSTIPADGIFAGTVAAGLTGFVALKILLKLVRKGHLYYFSPYCWVLGSVALVWHYLG
jgi:undecaprenyl-diphosphatase